MKANHVSLLLACAAVCGPPTALSAADDHSTTDHVVNLRITRRFSPPYPQRMVTAGINQGEAHLIALVDETGKLSDTLVTAYTDKAFADSAVATLRRWRFEPTRVNGIGADTVLRLEFAFSIGEVLVRETPIGDTLKPNEFADVRLVYRARDERELDEPPTPVHIVDPKYPELWRNLGITGRVIVEFYIDESGRARMPIAIESPHRWLGASAIAAIEQWVFVPPTCHGEPTLARVRQTIRFAP